MSWTVSICRLHDAPLFQAHNGCNCDPEQTMMAERVDVARVDEATEVSRRRFQAGARLKEAIYDLIDGQGFTPAGVRAEVEAALAFEVEPASPPSQPPSPNTEAVS